MKFAQSMPCPLFLRERHPIVEGMTLLGDWIEHRGPGRPGLAMGAPGHGADAARRQAGAVLAQNTGDEDTPPQDPPAGGTPDSGPRDTGTGDPKPADGQPPRNPWAPEGSPASRRPSGIEEIFRQRRPGGTGGGQGGGPGGGPGLPPRMPGPDLSNLLRLPPRRGGGSWWPAIVGGAVALGLLLSSTHQLGLHDQGIVTTFGQYTRTLQPGFSATLPWPFQDVAVTDVTTIKQVSVPSGEAENLMLTSDQSLVNISYVIRWSIKDLKLYSFQLKDPEGTVTEVAEAAMRATIAEVRLTDVMGGTPSAEIGEHVRQRMQAVLDAYHSGVQVEGVDLKKADPPAKVNEAFQKVQAAQQDRNRYIQQARGYAQQTIARAEGEAAAFDRVYTQYKAAPEVTRRRMYYETMDRVLSNNDKVILPTGPATYLPLPEIRHPAPPLPDAGPVPQQGNGQ
jgi:modulator of FtsH protease HflK